jgi:hypothetical protein
VSVARDLMHDQASFPLEWRLTSGYAFGLATASPLQRAICRVIDGKPLSKPMRSEPAVLRAFGGSLPDICAPREVAIIAGVRVAKSLIAACTAVHWTQRCDVSQLGPGETPRVSVVSTSKDNAGAIYDHIVGRMQASPMLRHLIVGDPASEHIMVRHPSGRLVEIAIVAGKRAGTSLVSRWSAGCIFDEFPRMDGADEAVVNWDHQRVQMLNRLLPGAQILNVGSPWTPAGPAYEMVRDHWGAPTDRLVVIKASAIDMWPAYWTPERIAKAKESPDAFRTDVLGEFASPEDALFPADLVAKAIRPTQEPDPRLVYVAAMDPATRGNGWTCGIFTRDGRKKRMVAAKEWRGSRTDPLSPRDVLKELADFLRPYRVTRVSTDRYYIDALVDLARDVGLSLDPETLTDKQRSERYLAVRNAMAAGDIELVADVRADMIQLRKRVTPAGVSIVLPQTRDGRHCDFAPVVMLGIGRWLHDAANFVDVEEDGLLKRRFDDGRVEILRDVRRRDPETQKMVTAALKRWGRRDPLSPR